MKEKSKGLGDSIKKITDAIGIKQCDKYKKRQEKLNKMFPYNEDVATENKNKQLAKLAEIRKKLGR
jgi:hypothetical protein